MSLGILKLSSISRSARSLVDVRRPHPGADLLNLVLTSHVSLRHATAVVAQAISRTQVVRFQAIAFTLIVSSFNEPRGGRGRQDAVRVRVYEEWRDTDAISPA